MYKPKTLVVKNFVSHTHSEYDFTTKPILLLGENLDDPGQKVNGSGKSALIEAISYLLVGSTIRGVKDRELIQDGETSSFLSISLTNSFLNQTLYIERTLSVNKSATCYIEVNGKEVVKASPNEYNSYILSLLGFSKDDFWNFFLVTKEKYKPFFLSTDTTKKTIINRFSKAEMLDTIDFKSKSQELELQKKNIEFSINGIEQKIEGIKTAEVDKEEVKRQIEHNKQQIIEKESENLTRDGFIFDFKQEIEPLNVEVEEKKRLVKVLKIGFDQSISTLLKEHESEKLLRIEQIVSENTGRTQGLEAQIKEKEGERVELLNLYKEVEKEVLDIQSKITKNKSILSSSTIDCPKCEHKFILNSDLTIEDIEKLVSDLELKFKQLSDELEFVALQGNKVKEKITMLVRLLGETETNFVALKRQVEKNFATKLEKREEEIRREFEESKVDYEVIILEKGDLIDSKLLQIKKLEQVNSLSEELIKTLSNQVKELELILDGKNEELIKKLDLNLVEQKDLLVVKNKEIEKNLIWELRMKKFKSYLSNLSLNTIQNMVNEYLKSLKSNLQVSIEGYRELSDGRFKEEIDCTIIRDGYLQSSYGRYSSGERGRVDISTILSLQHIINMSSPSGGLDLLVIDEVLDSIDVVGIQSIISSLNVFEKNIILVSQNDIYSEECRIVLVKKQDRASRIQISNN